MEEEKAAAYYNELVRKGEGAARFKQGLGFSSSSAKNDDAFPTRGSALPLSSSFHTSFVKASIPSKAADFQKQANLETIQNKLKKKPPHSLSSEFRQPSSSSRVTNRERDDRDRHSRRRSRSRDGRGSRHRRRSNSRDRERRRGRRSRSRSDSDEDRRRRRDRRRSRSGSPRDDRRREKSGSDRRRKAGNEKNVAIDYSRLIQGYETMTPAERVKAKMKLQLSETAEKDAANGMGPGWERFDFDKDAPLDDEEIEAADDDVALVKHIGQSFRFSAVEAKREDQIKAAHDEAMFGAPSIPIPPSTDEDDVEEENDKNESKESVAPPSLISNMVISRQQGSWRDRARKA